jgi:trigger factor
MENNQKQDNDLEIPVQLADYKGIKAKKNKLKVEKAEIDSSLDYLRKSRAKIITVNRPAEKGNRVEIDFEVRHGGVKIENGMSKNHPLILGEGRFLPGFEKELEGMSAGEEKNFSLKAPKDWPDKRVAEKNLDFKVKMNLVQERQIPELNDEFAKSLGNFASLETLKENVSGGLLEEKEIKEKQRIRIELIEKVAENSKIEIPESLIAEELDKMINEFKFSISGFGLDFDKYLEEIKKTTPELKKEWKNQAEKRVRIAMCLKAIAEKEQIEISDEEIENKINEELKNYPNVEEVKKNIDLKALRVYTKEVLRNEKVLGLLEKEAIIN